MGPFPLLQEQRQGDALDGFAETHLIGQDAAPAPQNAGGHPTDAFHLVRSQHPGQFADFSPDLVIRDLDLIRRSGGFIAKVRCMRPVNSGTFRSQLQRDIPQRLLQIVHSGDVEDVTLPIAPLHRALAGAHQSQHLGTRQAEAVGRFIGQFHAQPVPTARLAALRHKRGFRSDALDSPSHTPPAFAF